MADERDDKDSGNEGATDQATAGQQSHRSEYGSQGRESDDGMSGQPIGGNDSNTGSGTTLTAGYTPPDQGQGQRLSSDGTGALAANQGSDSATHTRDEGGGTTSNAGSSNAGRDQTSGGSSGVSGGEGFIGSQGGDSDDYLQDREGTSNSSSDATPGSDFANQGRGATDDDDANEDDSGSTGSSGSGGESF